MLNSLSDFFSSIGVHPIIGGFLSGVMFCVLLLMIKKAIRHEPRGTLGNDLARFRDPDAFGSGSTPSANLPIATGREEKVLPDHIRGEVIQSLRAGNKIEAIKIFKEATGLGLKKSKDIIEELQRKLGT